MSHPSASFIAIWVAIITGVFSSFMAIFAAAAAKKRKDREDSQDK